MDESYVRELMQEYSKNSSFIGRKRNNEEELEFLNEVGGLDKIEELSGGCNKGEKAAYNLLSWHREILGLSDKLCKVLETYQRDIPKVYDEDKLEKCLQITKRDENELEQMIEEFREGREKIIDEINETIDMKYLNDLEKEAKEDKEAKGKEILRELGVEETYNTYGEVKFGSHGNDPQIYSEGEFSRLRVKLRENFEDEVEVSWDLKVKPVERNNLGSGEFTVLADVIEEATDVEVNRYGYPFNLDLESKKKAIELYKGFEDIGNIVEKEGFRKAVSLVNARSEEIEDSTLEVIESCDMKEEFQETYQEKHQSYWKRIEDMAEGIKP